MKVEALMTIKEELKAAGVPLNRTGIAGGSSGSGNQSGRQRSVWTFRNRNGVFDSVPVNMDRQNRFTKKYNVIKSSSAKF